MRIKNIFQNIWKYIDIKGEDECWKWKRCKDGKGYGVTSLGGKQYLIHRLVYEQTYTKIPEGIFVCHSCDNPACCNPMHLWLGTHQDNMNDMYEKGRGNKSCGEEHYNVILSDRDVLEIREKFTTGNYTQTKLGKMFGVCHQHISDIVNNKRRNHI